MASTYEVWSLDHYIETIGTADQVREWFEENVEAWFGFFVMLQECEDGGEFRIYLHTDKEEDLTDEQLNAISMMGLDIRNDDKTWDAIQNILGVYVYDNRLYPFKGLSLEAKRTAVKEFIVDFEMFFREDESVICSFGEAYRILLSENEEHRYDSKGILVSNGGCY